MFRKFWLVIWQVAFQSAIQICLRKGFSKAGTAAQHQAISPSQRKDRILVTLQSGPKAGYALSVANDGPVLSAEFDVSSSNGLGMRIVQAFVSQIGGKLQVVRRDQDQGMRFIVLFLG